MHITQILLAAILSLTFLMTPIEGISPAFGGADTAFAGCGIDRTALMASSDLFNWQTGINQRCTIPTSWTWNQCAIIDAAHLVVDGQFISGPVFDIVPGPMNGSRIEVIEGQVVIPKPGNFAKRFMERLQVAWKQAHRMFVPDGFGGMRPRREPTTLNLVQLECPDDP